MTAACERSKALVKGTSGERFPVGKLLPKRSGAVPLGCHAEINKILLIGQVLYTGFKICGILVANATMFSHLLPGF